QAQPDEFVQVVKGKFVLGCSPFYVSGWNSWELMEAAAGALELFGASLPLKSTGPQLVRDVLDAAVSAGHNVIRVWAHPVSEQYAMEPFPGEYNEALLVGLDYILDEARVRGLKLLVVLMDNWQPGGINTLVGWAGEKEHEKFFDMESTRAMYRERVRKIVGRTNSINGRRYSEDPTIMAWNLLSEPRCYQCAVSVARWIDEMAAFVKSLDSRHLLGIGEEGFYATGLANPLGMASWAFNEGQDFVRDHNSSDIDFATVHLWPDNWKDTSASFTTLWLRQHLADCHRMGKPMLLEEFGKYGVGGGGADRQSYYRQVLNIMAEDSEAGGPSMGAMFFQYYAPGQRAPQEEGGNAGGLFGVYSTDGAYGVSASFAERMRALNQGAAGGGAACRVQAAAESPTPAPRLGRAAYVARGSEPVCKHTWVDGRRGTGMEGPNCVQDVNECVRGTHSCAAQGAVCVNNHGGYKCSCQAGYSGDGHSCKPDSQAMAELTAKFSTPGMGRLACNEGKDVAFDAGMPGFAYDPIGYLERTQGAYGSRVAVEDTDCMAACSEAPGCNAFSYNPVLQKCFLKVNPSTQVCQAEPVSCVSARGSKYDCGRWQTYYGNMPSTLEPNHEVALNNAPMQLNIIIFFGVALAADALCEELEGLLLSSDIGNTLCHLIGAVDDAKPAQIQQESTVLSIVSIMGFLLELADISGPADFQQHGRSFFGSQVIPAVLALAANASIDPSVRRESAAVLQSYVTGCHANCHILGSRGVEQLFRSTLVGCEDAGIQMDVLEVAYRCGRARVDLESLQQVIGAPGWRQLKHLVTQAPKTLDLAVELHAVMAFINRGKEARLCCIKMAALKWAKQGKKQIETEQTWVSFGLDHLSVLVINDGHEESAELVDIAYGDLQAHCKTQGDATRWVWSLSELPESLHARWNISEGDGSPWAVETTVPTEAFDQALAGAPLVARALSEHGLWAAEAGGVSVYRELVLEPSSKSASKATVDRPVKSALKAASSEQRAGQAAARAVLVAEAQPAKETVALSAKKTVALSAKETVAPSAKQTAALSAKEIVAPSAKQTAALSAKQTAALSAKESVALSAKQAAAPSAKKTAALSAKKTIALPTKESATVPSKATITPPGKEN
ncbi:hypothetical protein H632_c239p0, partial [Helicosporidium sp. ATCC 50920]